MDSLIFPEEFHFLGITEYSSLCDLVDRWFGDRSMPERVDRQNGMVELGGGCSMGLLNVFQSCHAMPPSDWAGELDAHLSFAVLDQKAQLETPLGDIKNLTYDQAKEGIKVRIRHKDFPDAGTGYFVKYPICDEFLTVLELDTERATVNLDPNLLTTWGKSAEELWYVGLDNVWNRDYVAPEAQEIGGLGNVFAISSDSFFTTSHLLMLGKHFPGTDHRGFLVAIPNRHILLCKEISAIHDLNILPRLLFGAQKMYEEGPGSISAKLFWWHDQRIEPIQIEASNREFHFAPSPELKVALNL